MDVIQRKIVLGGKKISMSNVFGGFWSQEEFEAATDLVPDTSVVIWRESQSGVGFSKAPAFDNLKIIQVSVGADYCLALSSSGRVWRLNFSDKKAMPVSECDHIKNIRSVHCSRTNEVSFIITTKGELYSWGQNEDLLGRIVTDREPKTIPNKVKIEGVGNIFTGVEVIDIQTGLNFCIALTNSEGIWSWGKSTSGRLGYGGPDSPLPTLIPELEKKSISKLSVGWGHAAALEIVGQVYVWGSNNCGQLGLGHAKDVDTPSLVKQMLWVRLVDVSCGLHHTAYVTELGQVYVTGDLIGEVHYSPQLVPFPQWCIGIQSSYYGIISFCRKSTALRQLNGVYSNQPTNDEMTIWLCSKSTLSVSTETTENQQNNKTFSPVHFSALDKHIILSSTCGANSCFIVQVEVKSPYENQLKRKLYESNNDRALYVWTPMHSRKRRINQRAVEANSKLKIWGNVKEGLFDSPSAVLKKSVKGYHLVEVAQKSANISSVAANSEIVLCLSASGQFLSLCFSSGGEEKFEFEDDSVGGEWIIPEKTPSFDGSELKRQTIISIGANEFIGFAITEKGVIYIWLWPHSFDYNTNNVSQKYKKMVGRTENLFVPRVLVGVVIPCIELACGSSHIIGLTEDMRIMSWGENDYGQLGRKDESVSFGVVEGITAERIVQIGAGDMHSAALTIDGRMYVWGRGDNGRLGIPGRNIITIPAQLQMSLKIKSFVCGARYTCFLTADGGVYFSGSIGDFPQETLTPTLVSLPFWCVSLYGTTDCLIAVCETPDGTGKSTCIFSWGARTIQDNRPASVPQSSRVFEGEEIMSLEFSPYQNGFWIAIVLNTELSKLT